ncbi:glycine/betaine/sarcosine/D-proline family reductase selenoprotein B [Erysipelothrix sp. HDW6C]|uniref:GrdB-related putative oxidoreductase n=1 Tax=Erysipelothrix sp. HDW6C TaxID=2714930 RepID=UPI00140850DA|nr:GrdB-related putative oxidoreductase [Erysipelothrix sp. HDW6C]QIK68951.1 glycine/betaine/sarcosine/D-proline family reductase selenoprotein B [Erysipelothrix sp. HDW6C]
MRILLFFDQTQAGAGGKERPNVELAVEKGGIGSYHMFEKFIKEAGGTVLATMYCGNGYFFDNEEEVKRKIVALTTKLKADVVICGPCFNYADYAHMSAIIAQAIEAGSDSKAIVVCSEENAHVIESFKDSVTIVKMPKKGGIGLNDSLINMIKVAKAKVEGQAKETYQEYTY